MDRKFMSVADMIKVNDRLHSVIVKLPNGLCHYTDGHSDKTIADELGLTQSHVARVRKEMYGQIDRKDAKQSRSVSYAQFNRLVSTLEACFPQHQWNHLYIHNGDECDS